MCLIGTLIERFLSYYRKKTTYESVGDEINELINGFIGAVVFFGIIQFIVWLIS